MATTRLGLYGGPRAALAVDGVETLNAVDVEAASEVSAPVLGQEHALTVVSVESASEVTTPAISIDGENALLADDIESPSEVSNPTLGQVHAILAADTQSTSEVSAPVLADIGAVYDLLADDLESASETGAPTIGQTHVITSEDIQGLSEVSSPALSDGTVQPIISTKKGGGRRVRYVIEVDGKPIEVATISEAESILRQVRALADDAAQKDVTTSTTPKPPRVSVKTISGKKTTSKVLQQEIIRTQKTVTKAYVRRARQIAQDTEKSQLIIGKIAEEERDDENAIIALLLM